jgi:hypothetical protein
VSLRADAVVFLASTPRTPWTDQIHYVDGGVSAVV